MKVLTFSMTAPWENCTKISIYLMTISVVWKSAMPYLGFTLGFHSKIISQNTCNMKPKHREIVNDYIPLPAING